MEKEKQPAQESWIDRLSGYGAVIGGWLLAIMAAMVSYEVLLRYLFSMPTIWSMELSIYCMIGSAFLGGAHLLKNDGHVRVTLLTQALSPKKRIGFRLATSLMMLLLFCTAFYQGLRIVIQSFTQDFLSVPLRIPMFIPQMIIPLGALLFIFQLITMIKKDVNQIRGQIDQKEISSRGH